MIDMARLNEYSRFINLKQVCDTAGVSYFNVKNKLLRFRAGSRSKLNQFEMERLTKRLATIGCSFQNSAQIK